MNLFKLSWVLAAAMLLVTPKTIALTFAELKQQVQLEQDNSLKLNLLQEADSERTQFTRAQQAEYWLWLGKSLDKQHRMNEAMSAFSKGVDTYTEHALPPSNILVNLLIERARAAGNIDHYNSSGCKDREQALQLARELAQPSLIAKSIAYYARCLQSEEHGIAKGFKLFDEAFNIAKTHQLSPHIKQIIFNQAATLAFRALIYDKAYEYNKLAYDLFTETNDVKSIYNSILNAIHYSIALVNVELAQQHLTELAQFAERYPEFNDAKLKYNYLSAKVAQLEHDWPLSISFLEAGLSEVQGNQNISYIQATYELLSITYFRVGEIEKSYQTLSAIEEIYPDKKPIKKEVMLVKGVMEENPEEIARSALSLIDKAQQSKNRFVKQSTIQSAQLFDDNLKQLDNIILEQRLIIVFVATVLIVTVLLGFSYLQIQRKKLAQKEHQLMDELLNKKNQLLADVSHELGTPLTVLKLQVESLKDDLEDDVHATYDALDNKLSDLEVLIDDIHQLAQSDIGALQLNIEQLELNSLLEGWRIELTEFVNRNKLDFSIEIALPTPLVVKFDPDRLKQVFTNLISNSIKYTDKPGKVKLSASVEGKLLQLSIADSGPGVSDAELGNIFERLYRVENSRSRETGGSGLGLAICKSLIEAHGGMIHAQHSDLGGLKINISLPI